MSNLILSDLCPKTSGLSVDSEIGFVSEVRDAELGKIQGGALPFMVAATVTRKDFTPVPQKICVHHVPPGDSTNK